MSKLEKPLRVVVCGTTFGRVYLRGIAQMPEEFELAGILARGSSHSARCAEEYHVPLYTDIDQLANVGVDMACVVVRSTVGGGAGTELANDLLLRGIHVLQEYPVHHNDVVKCLRSARKATCSYRINSFYPELDTVRSFILTARQALQKSKAVYIDAACSLQVLFPLVDILGQSLGGFRPWSFLLASNPVSEDPFCSLSGQIRGIPVSLRVQNQINPADPDNHTHLLHRIVLGTNSGSLMLTDTHGFVLWNPRMHVERETDGILALDGSDPFFSLAVTEPVTPIKNITFTSVFNGLWTEGIKRSLRRFRETVLAGKEDQQLAQYQLTACQVWQDIGLQLGPARIIAGQSPNPLGLAGFQEAGSENNKEGRAVSKKS
ncbi:Gfo/Idh/MocA family oxidoreductase [Sporomusa sp. KB1]|jgi:thiazolinyl imide reductase|uniref:Gfo/Idh/MocA family oxidoreductase n=1 Tax=Sporomusa sp. KB1 TaxID=943346 RepID=UPI0011AA5926|nr:Gfo/Idh/MocA family oxidoreductase [Sporomusa sp. KB1]TWH46108.1 thiazolinyl imide reductase [Sporomusa sp. KB1]